MKPPPFSAPIGGIGGLPHRTALSSLASLLSLILLASSFCSVVGRVLFALSCAPPTAGRHQQKKPRKRFFPFDFAL
jgi:hypothetical protein